MKKLSSYLALACLTLMSLAQQPTPNIGLQIPVTGSNNWYIPLNYNFSKLDQLLSGNLSLPALSVTNNVTIGGTVTANNFTTGGGSSFAAAVPASQYSPVYYSGTGSSSTLAGVSPFTGLLWYRSSNTPTNATSANVGSLFSGCASGTPALRFDGTCYAPSGGGSSFPGVLNQQVFSAGGGAGTASNATLDAAGNGVFKSYGGTKDAFLNQTGTGTNDGIANSLQTIGNFATVNQGYAATELPSVGFNMRAPIFNTGFFFGIPTPSIAYNTMFEDRRANSVGTTYYNPYSASHAPMVYNKLVKDDDEAGSNSQATNYFPFVDGIVHLCCGVSQNGNTQSNVEFYTVHVMDNVGGISGVYALEYNHNGIGDTHGRQNILHCNGGTTNFSDEFCDVYRDEVHEDPNPFWGTVPATAKGTKVIAVTPGSNSNGPGEGKYLVNVTQQGSQFHITELMGVPAYPAPGLWRTDRTFTSDTFCQVDNALSAPPPLTKGQTTPTTVNLGNCTAAITTTDSVCVASATGAQQVKVTSAGVMSGGAQQIVVNLEKPVVSQEFFAQGPNACKVVEVLANQKPGGSGAQPYRYIVRVIGNAPWQPNTSLYYVADGAGNWTNAPVGNFNLAAFGAGTVLTRNGSGDVSATGGVDFSHSFPGTKIHVIAPDASYNGVFTVTSETGTGPTTITWHNPGTAGTTTTTVTNWFVASNGFDVSAVVMGPGALIMRANNPTTRSADGTVVIEEGNNITMASNDVVSAGPRENNPMGLHHQVIDYTGFPSPSLQQGIATLTQIFNPCDGCSFQQVTLEANTADYLGGGGFRGGFTYRNTTGGALIWGGYDFLSAPLSGGYIRHVVGCGLHVCSDTGAFYDTDDYDGNGGVYQATWKAYANDFHHEIRATGAGTTAIDETPSGYTVSVNDGAGTSNVFSVFASGASFGHALTVTAGITSTGGNVTGQNLVAANGQVNAGFGLTTSGTERVSLVADMTDANAVGISSAGPNGDFNVYLETRASFLPKIKIAGTTQGIIPATDAAVAVNGIACYKQLTPTVILGQCAVLAGVSCTTCN